MRYSARATPRQEECTADSWTLFDTARSAAKAGLRGQEGLDTIGARQLAARLAAAYDGLVRADGS
ncbi:hypothetical protein [Streptomyces sp. NBC_00120]|uniref:Transcriptional regulator n=1 Tax=Streptomyces sp. NBC_00119 TaxID=2975659 RepID=A0AAU1U4U9_9ACTN|nr:hypothetical protein [Streptomyces sp. NBC_00120]MCX5321815.1 hypothetical protein [Streptomyces sp. NBC_00120]